MMMWSSVEKREGCGMIERVSAICYMCCVCVCVCCVCVCMCVCVCVCVCAQAYTH